MALVKTELPKSRSGRQATPLDQTLVDDLIGALKKEPTVNGRPAAYGPDTAFDTEGKASSAGRRYANAVQDALDTTVRVNTYQKGEGEKAPWLWRCYIPLSLSEGKGKKGSGKK